MSCCMCLGIVGQIVMSVIVSLECCWVWAQETADEGQGAGEVEGGRAPPPASSPLTVKEIMFNVIEMQLMKNQTTTTNKQTVPTGPAPTISSILKTDHGFAKSGSLATLSVVSAEMPKENLVVVQVHKFGLAACACGSLTSLCHHNIF